MYYVTIYAKAAQKVVQRYNFFLIYANLFDKSYNQPTFLCESVIHVKVKPTRMTEWVSSYSFLQVVSLIFSIRWLFRHRLRTMLMDEPLTD